jgi:hypothetical protein
MESDKQTAAMCAFIAQMVGLFLIPAAGYVARLLGASKGGGCFFSWIAAVAWGIGICGFLGAWCPIVTPGWDLFPEATGAVPFIFFGWIAGFIGHEAAEVTLRRNAGDSARNRRSRLIAVGVFVVGLLVISVCIGTIKLVGTVALRDFVRIEFATNRMGVFIKERGAWEHRSYYNINIGHQISPGAPVTPLGQTRENIRDFTNRPIISEGHGLLGIILKREHNWEGSYLAIRTFGGEWKEFDFSEGELNQWPALREEFEKRGLTGSRRKGSIHGLDLEQRIVTANYFFHDDVPVRFRISEDGTSLEFLGIDWPGGVAP